MTDILNVGLIRMRYTPYGGAETFVSRFIDELVKRGHTCHIFAAAWDKDLKNNVVMHRVITLGPSFLRLWSFAIGSYFSVKKANLDIVLSFDRTLYQDIYRAGDGCHREWLIQRDRARGRGDGARGIKTMRKILTFLSPLHLTILFLEKRLFQSKNLKFVIANSKRGKEEIIKHYGLPEEKIYVIYNGIDAGKFDPKEKDALRSLYREKLKVQDKIVLLFVGSGFERKGLEFLMNAVAHLQKDGNRQLALAVVGKGNIKKYQRIADRVGIGKDVQFLGPVSDIRGYYYAGDVFVLPSIYEPFSNACLEAMAYGLPVVTSRMNGASEILTPGKNGMIINDPTDPREIADRIKPFLDQAVRSSAGSMAQMAVQPYTMQKNVETFLNTLESKVEGGQLR